jgi:hypothetical protein
MEDQLRSLCFKSIDDYMDCLLNSEVKILIGKVIFNLYSELTIFYHLFYILKPLIARKLQF